MGPFRISQKILEENILKDTSMTYKKVAGRLSGQKA